MSLILSADWHVDQNPHFGIEKGVEAISYIIRQAARTRTRTLLVAGDVTDKPTAGGLVLDALAQLIELSIAEGIEMVWLRGNHELDRWDYSLTAFLKRLGPQIPNLKVAAYAVEHMRVESMGLNLVLAPFGTKGEEIDQYAQHNRLKGRGLVLAHDEVVGARYRKGGLESSAGFSREDIRRLNERGFCVALGHIHYGQSIEPDHKAFYIAAPLQFNYGAVGDTSRGYCKFFYKDGAPRLKRFPMVGGPWPLFLDHELNEWIEDGPLLPMDQEVYLKIRTSDTRSDDVLLKMIHDGAENKEALQKVEIEREDQKVEPVVRRSDIEPDDSIRTIQTKYLKAKFAKRPKAQRVYSKLMEPILKEMGL